MRKMILAVLLCPAFCIAQRATVQDGVLTYKDSHISVGDTVNIAYGSGQDGKFVFVLMGSGLGGTEPLESNFSKSEVVVDKIYKSSGRYLVRGKVLHSGVGALGGNKIFIEPEGAIDKKEIEL